MTTLVRCYNVRICVPKTLLSQRWNSPRDPVSGTEDTALSSSLIRIWLRRFRRGRGPAVIPHKRREAVQVFTGGIAVALPTELEARE
jgi:hypothetical protein